MNLIFTIVITLIISVMLCFKIITYFILLLINNIISGRSTTTLIARNHFSN